MLFWSSYFYILYIYVFVHVYIMLLMHRKWKASHFLLYTSKAEGYPWVVSIFPVCESHETCQEHIQVIFHPKIEITPNIYEALI